MAAEDRARWDDMYQARVLRAYPPPDALLVAYAPPVQPGQRRVALDLAAGQCQNALWLAEQGYYVNALDISREALERGRAEMAMRNLRNVNFIVADLDRPDLPEAGYDLIVVCRFLARPLFPLLKLALKPGGLMIYQTFNLNHLERRPEATRSYLLEPRELASFFSGWALLHDEEAGEMSRLVARKPEDTSA